MKKKIISIMFFAIFTTSCMLCGCNKQIFDTTYTFNYCQISMPDGTLVEGKIQSWTDFDDGDQIQIKIDGVTYLTDTTRCVLIRK